MLRTVISICTALIALALTGCQADSTARDSSPAAGVDPATANPAAPPPGIGPSPGAGPSPATGSASAVPSARALPPANRPPSPRAQAGATASVRARARALPRPSAAAPAAPKPKSADPATRPVARAAGRQIRVSLTGYSYHDNTPAGSPEVCCGVLHDTASGKGTYADPITVAVPGSGGGMDWKPGTRFYLPTLQRYLIVEDSGASSGDNHLDVWIDGRDGSRSATDSCMDRITGKSTAELNPPPGRPVMTGPIFSGGRCRLPK